MGLALTAASMGQQAQASREAGKLALKVGAQNRAVDDAAAAQLETNTAANLRREKEENAAYISKQQTAYAASGVLANTGSPLDVEATTAGRLEQGIQQKWIDSQVQAGNIRRQGQYGQMYMQGQADSAALQANISTMKGGAQLASQAYGAYESGAFRSSPSVTASGPASKSYGVTLPESE